jgi:hypothetical protein
VATKRRVELFGQFHQFGEHFFLVGQPVVHQFHKKVFFAENLPVLVQRLFGFFRPVGQQRSGHLPFQTPRQPHQPFGVLGQNLFVDAGFVVIAFQKRLGGQFHQVAVTRFVDGQEG